MPATDYARFHAADDPAMVTAAFCCPYCLHTASAAALGAAADDGTSIAACRCDPCAQRWEVSLDAMQTLRLSISPPRRPPLTWRPLVG